MSAIARVAKGTEYGHLIPQLQLGVVLARPVSRRFTKDSMSSLSNLCDSTMRSRENVRDGVLRAIFGRGPRTRSGRILKRAQEATHELLYDERASDGSGATGLTVTGGPEAPSSGTRRSTYQLAT